jgi:hypothetical protein
MTLAMYYCVSKCNATLVMKQAPDAVRFAYRHPTAPILNSKPEPEKWVARRRALRGCEKIKSLLRTPPIPAWLRYETRKIRLHSPLCARIFHVSRLASRVWRRSRYEFDFFTASESGRRIPAPFPEHFPVYAIPDSAFAAVRVGMMISPRSGA